jgi:BirA family biotin operon repressor/biotin-[acetyl-CoA-carboxylase] ligase
VSADRRLGQPRIHLRVAGSTNERARELAAAAAPHGTLVTAGEQTAGRGRQGRTWAAPAGRALLCSVVVREPPRLLPLAAGVAVAEVVGDEALLKWPNDVLVNGLKVAGILVEGRPAERWAVVGIGLNVALAESDLPPELRGRAGTLGLRADAIEPMLATLLAALERWIEAPEADLLGAVRARDALLGVSVRWAQGSGRGAGIDAGEVHLQNDL